MTFRGNFFHCCKRNDVEGLHLLIKMGADINIQDNDGNTPLYEASQHKSKESLHLLIGM